MWIVQLALRRPYTFIVLAIFILIAGALSILQTPKDIFPDINIPVCAAIWSFTGMPAQEFSNRITSVYERILTTVVNDIEHIESTSYNGIGVVKIYLQPNASVPVAMAQLTAASQAVLKQLPPGETPPLILSFSASNVPVLRLGLSGKTFSEQQLNDLALNFLRIQLVTVPGAAVPYPYGGKQRVVSIDLNAEALQARGLSPTDVINAVNAQNIILPSGTAKIGTEEFDIGLNSSPKTLKELEDIPVRTMNGTTTYIRDVANVRDGFTPQTNIVRFDGRRATMLQVQKNGKASTLDIVQGEKALVQRLKSTLPEGLNIQTLSDQSIFVTAAIEGVIKEAVIAGCLTALMILIFLGSWRSTLIIAVSIPLSILTSLAALSALGETINIMTLGGLALAVGILVDDATVTIENIDRHLEEGKSLHDGILDGAAQIAVPAFVSTLCICIVFVPIFFLSGTAKFLFAPLGEAVIFAMLASYILSRTLVPTLAMYWLGGDHAKHNENRNGEFSQTKRKTGILGVFGGFSREFNKGFERFRQAYRDLLAVCLGNTSAVAVLFLGLAGATMLLVPWLGQDFFPLVDSGQFTLHVRMKSGTRIEEVARRVDQIEAALRQEIPKEQLKGIIDNIGLPYSGINLTYSNSGVASAADADILVSLAEKHDPTMTFVDKARRRIHRDFAGVTASFPPAGIVAQILNFGLPAPFDLQIVGANTVANAQFANRLVDKIVRIPGAVDVRVQQPFDSPRINLTVDRTEASQLGITESQIANALLGALSGSTQTNPNFWVDPKNGVSYTINSQSPQYTINSLDALRAVPILSNTSASSSPGAPTQILGNVVELTRSSEAPIVTHYNIQPVVEIFGASEGKDLGYVATEIQKVMDAAQKDLPKGSRMTLRGQVQTMRESFAGLIGGLIFAMLLVYLLMVVNFQSWTDPLIIISALPFALAGIVWALFITRTTLSVPALMGAIMCMGVGTANSVLVVTFAREQLQEHSDSFRSALQAGYARLRPVLMTAIAMVVGMVPMALGLGEGGEQNAPLGRAVIGGLLFATVATLFFVPTVFSVVHRRRRSPRQAIAIGASS
ncbi:MAG TPA: efflux RND transporter permease subunit [Chthoniobacterales bacterium]|jgi:multidrug efflux pump subunit AcrB|nr:efflux RND transporter permease subunit [Chthoniobacterales bacterium]